MNYLLFRTAIGLVTLGLFLNCNSETKASQTTDSENSNEIKTFAQDIKSETVTDGNRLTESSIETYLPSKIDKFSPRENAFHKTSVPRRESDGVNHRTTQVFVADKDKLTLTVTDFADDPRYVNQMLESGMKIGESGDQYSKSKTYLSDDDVYITESEIFRDNGQGKMEADERRITFRNARFIVEIESNKMNGSGLMDFNMLKTSFNNSNLSQLFSLPIPQGEEIEHASTLKPLDGDRLLPIPRVKEVCGNAEVKLFISDFEKETNINRTYTYLESDSRLILIISQYSGMQQSLKAVEYNLNSDKPKSDAIPNLGDLASIATVGSDLFLSVAHREYLIELRSFKGMGNDGICCNCLDKEKLEELAKGIISKLP